LKKCTIKSYQLRTESAVKYLYDLSKLALAAVFVEIWLKAGKDVNILKGLIGIIFGLGLYAGAVLIERKLEKEKKK